MMWIRKRSTTRRRRKRRRRWEDANHKGTHANDDLFIWFCKKIKTVSALFIYRL